jgi:flagellar basal-body rod protein FlgC
MSLFRIFDVAASGMSAQTLRLNTTASNLANADSVGSSAGGAYRARHPVFRATLDDVFNEAHDVRVQVAGIVESDAPLQRRFEPNHPLADADGYIFLPNVNTVEEMANMISASRSYQANVEIINTSKQLLLRTLSLGE